MKILKTLEKYILLATIFLTPILVIPIFPNAFRISKILILVLGVGLALLIKFIRTFVEGNFKLTSGNFDFPLFLLGVAYLLSGLFVTPNKPEAFFTPGSSIIFVSLTLFYFLLNQSKIEAKTIKSTLIYSTLLYALISILSLSGLFSKIPQLPSFMKSSTFNTEGALLPVLMFLATILPFTVFSTLKEKDMVKKIFNAAITVFIASAIILNIVNLKTDKNLKLVLSDFKSSWIIAIDSLKQNPLLGIGAGNYQTAFNVYRPVSYNSTANWNIIFTSARNLYLTVLTETGLIGIASVIILLIVVFNLIRKNIKENDDVKISLILLLILLGIFPSSTTLLLVLYTLLSLVSEKKDFDINLTLKGQEGQKGSFILTRIPALFVALPVVIGLIFFSLTSVKTLRAEATFKKAADALIANKAKETYDFLIEAVKLNPSVDRYRTSYSQVSFALANSLARQQSLTDKDKQTVAQLIQQAIREGKAAVTLNITRSENWANLAGIYQSIIPFAQGSDTFAIQTYSQAVALDPVNPLTRISLGGVYYSLGRYDEAIRAFELAVIAKPDYANSHYNLAIALREKGDIEGALTQMDLVLSLVNKDSADYQLAKKAIADLEARKVTKAATTENLTAPQAAQKPVITPPITLPTDANPPVQQ